MTFILRSPVLRSLIVLSICLNISCLDVQCSKSTGLDECEIAFETQKTLTRPDKIFFIIPPPQQKDGVKFVTLVHPSNLTVASVPIEIFDQFPNLLRLNFTASISQISDSDFTNAYKLVGLSLPWNHLERIPARVFSTAPKLNSIELNHNDIQSIEDNAFDGLENLESIDLSANRLKRIGVNTFGTLPQLRSLILTNNSIEAIENGALNLPNLYELNLKSNKLTTLSDDLFAQTSGLYSLDLSKNGIQRLNNALYALQKLTFLYLNDNNIEDLDIKKLANMPKLETIKLQRSGFNLDNAKISASDLNANSTKSIVRDLDLSGNGMQSDVVFKKLRIFPKLEEVVLKSNRFMRLDLDQISGGGLPELRSIKIANNQLDLEWLNVFRRNSSIKVSKDTILL